MATFRKALIEKVIGHKYAIDAQWLGDDSLLAWSNLGYWQAQQHNYPLACQSLADQIAQQECPVRAIGVCRQRHTKHHRNRQ